MRTVKSAVRSMLFHLVLACLALLLAAVSHAAVYTVTQLADSNFPNPDPTILSLRLALSKANQHPGPDSISIPEGTYKLTIAGSGDDLNLSGDLDILDSVTITGAGPEKTIIDGNAIDRVFHLRAGLPSEITVKMENLTIQNGKVIEGVYSLGGAGVLNFQRLTLNNVVVRNNTAEGLQGAGIQNEGKLFLDKVEIKYNTVVGNDYTQMGGGIMNRGNLNITDSTVSYNQAQTGGGLFNSGLSNATIERTLFSENMGVSGSAIYAYGNLQLVNTTIHRNNFPGFTGGQCALRVENTANILFSTITNNLSTSDLAGLCVTPAATITLRGTILAGNKKIGSYTSNNCYYLGVTPTTATYNLEDADTCGFSTATNLINTDPRLGPLQNNGGPTLTRALLDGSPAIDYVKVNTGVTVDQRGFKRPVGSWADIGAYEYIPPTPICFPAKSPDGKTAIICL